MDDDDRDHDESDQQLHLTAVTTPTRQRFRIYEARRALGITYKTLIDWLVRAGYNLEEVVERADPNDLRQRYLPRTVVEDLAQRHARTLELRRWERGQDQDAENDQLRRRVGELQLELHAVRLLLEQGGGGGAASRRVTTTARRPRALPSTPSAPEGDDDPVPYTPPLLPARAPRVTRPLRPDVEHEDDRRFPLKDCPPLPSSMMAATTVCTKHGVYIRSMDELREKGIGPNIEEKPKDEPPWRSGNNRVRKAYTREQHLAACMVMAQRWPQRFISSCGPKCPYPDYLLRHASSSSSGSLSESSENV